MNVAELDARVNETRREMERIASGPQGKNAPLYLAALSEHAAACRARTAAMFTVNAPKPR